MEVVTRYLVLLRSRTEFSTLAALGLLAGASYAFLATAEGVIEDNKPPFGPGHSAFPSKSGDLADPIAPGGSRSCSRI